jgi:hypothetical protein
MIDVLCWLLGLVVSALAFAPDKAVPCCYRVIAWVRSRVPVTLRATDQ